MHSLPFHKALRTFRLAALGIKKAYQARIIRPVPRTPPPRLCLGILKMQRFLLRIRQKWHSMMWAGAQCTALLLKPLPSHQHSTRKSAHGKRTKKNMTHWSLQWSLGERNRQRGRFLLLASPNVWSDTEVLSCSSSLFRKPFDIDVQHIHWGIFDAIKNKWPHFTAGSHKPPRTTHFYS